MQSVDLSNQFRMYPVPEEIMDSEDSSDKGCTELNSLWKAVDRCTKYVKSGCLRRCTRVVLIFSFSVSPVAKPGRHENSFLAYSDSVISKKCRTEDKDARPLCLTLYTLILEFAL